MGDYTKCSECKRSFTEENVITEQGYEEAQISGLYEICFDTLFCSMAEE